MSEPFDIHCDQFQIMLNQYGCILNLMSSNPIHPQQNHYLGTVRMSSEHLKVMNVLWERRSRYMARL